METEVKDLKTRLTAADDRFSEYSSNAEQVAQKLRVQVTEKQEQLDETIMQLEIEREEKMTAILRNAEIAQSEDILRQQLRLERSEASDLQERNNQLVRDISEARQTLQQVSSTAQDNADKLTEFERVQLEIIEKNKVRFVMNGFGKFY